MYDFILIVCRFFFALLLLGYSALAVAIFWGLLGMPIRRRVTKTFAGTLAGAWNSFRFCASYLNSVELKSKPDAKGHYISQASPEKGITN